MSDNLLTWNAKQTGQVIIMGKVRRAFSIDERIEDRLERMARKGVSRSFFCNAAIRERLKKLGLW